MIVDGFGGDPDQGYFAIYDGHGGRGAVDFTAINLHKVVLLLLHYFQISFFFSFFFLFCNQSISV